MNFKINGYRVEYATNKPEYKNIINNLMKANSIKMNATVFAPEDFIDLLEMTYNPCFVILDNEEVIGFFNLTIQPQASYGILTYLVKETHRRKGIGSGILSFCEKLALSSNINYISADTFNNLPSENCLEKNGFILIGTYPERYRYFDGDKNIIVDKKMWIKKII